MHGRRIFELRKKPKMTEMEMNMVRALAAIDDALGLPQDGCNSTAQTLAKIKEMREQIERCENLARAVMADNVGKS